MQTIMEIVHGLYQGSWIRGPSVHNQCIEDLWRNLRYFCTCFNDLFRSIEDMGILNPNISNHLFALHYVFLPRLNSDIRTFSSV